MKKQKDNGEKMIEYIMAYNLDDTGKLINAKRREELIRCIDCNNYQKDWTPNSSDQYNRHYCVILGGMFTPNDYCSYGEKK